VPRFVRRGVVTALLAASPRSRSPCRRLVAALVVSRVSLTDIESLFARHPDGWAALYATYPGTPGLVEVGPVTFDDDARSAQITVGRSCGENCRMAWQVTLAVQDDRAWRVRDVGPVRPR
jgi:hypothetical protein